MKIKILVLLFLLLVFHLVKAAVLVPIGDMTEQLIEEYTCQDASSFASGRGLNCPGGDCSNMRILVGGQSVSLASTVSCPEAGRFVRSTVGDWDMVITEEPGEAFGQPVVVMVHSGAMFASLESRGVYPDRGVATLLLELEVVEASEVVYSDTLVETCHHTGPNTQCFGDPPFCIPETLPCRPIINFDSGRFSAHIGDVLEVGFTATTEVEIPADFYSGAESQIIVDAGLVVSLDADSDGQPDELDNCSQVANGPLVPDAGGNSQRDTDGDGYGNHCDPDFDQNGVVNEVDRDLLIAAFGSNQHPHLDLDGDGIVGLPDYSILLAFMGLPPGPSGLVP